MQGRTELHVDQWVWGKEKIVWGYDPTHLYTLKILEPKVGREGCLSLQYHHQKSETWIAVAGISWALVVVGDQVCTRLMQAGDIQNLMPEMIHRLTAVTPDARIIEPSTPDKHAADKSVTKDVVRLHCVHGRPCAPARDERERRIVEQCAAITEEALIVIARGGLPPEVHPEKLIGNGSFRVDQYSLSP